ncbi:MAG: TIGR04076 family protein [Chloroflexi bacterium]|nr:TIGR04076 family protein [Chloroflexota bacterium]MDA8189130.1 TIGR04076 family protein [Dehalococcoidales bacterium]
MYDLRVVVEEVKGFCDLPMAAGDYFDVKGGRLHVPPGKYMCIWALQALMPLLPAKQREIAEVNDWINETSRICCPDPNGMVIFRVDRVPIDPHEPGAEAVPRAKPQHDGGTSPAPVAETPGKQPEKVSIGHMIVDAAVCSGCRACEMICSFTHESVFSPELSRVQVAKDEPAGKDTPFVCRQCGNARCLEVCPKNALRRHPTTKAVLVDQSTCSGCGLCAEACPFEVVRMHPLTKVPLLCDLCGGDPQCVPRCVTGALWYGEAQHRPKRKLIGPQIREQPSV